MASGAVLRVADDPWSLSACAQVLARAFADDPLMKSIWPDPRRRARALTTYFGATLRHEHSVVGAVEYVAVNGAPAAVAAWDGPSRGSTSDQLRRTVRAAPKLLTALRSRLPVGVDVRRRLDSQEPSEPHWLLVNLGVDEQCRGEGFARMLIEHRLAEVDLHHESAHLVWTRAENVPLYERFGFTTTTEFRLSDGTPLWVMDRR